MTIFARVNRWLTGRKSSCRRCPWCALTHFGEAPFLGTAENGAFAGGLPNAVVIIFLKPSRVTRQVDDLLLAADIMRLTGHPKRAVSYLNQVVHLFPNDARRALAAVTLGKVLLNKLGKPRAAAEGTDISLKALWTTLMLDFWFFK